MLETKLKTPLWGDQKANIHEKIKGYVAGYRQGRALLKTSLWKQHLIENTAYFFELGKFKNRILCVYDGTPQDQFILQSYLPSLETFQISSGFQKEDLEHMDLVLILNPTGRKGLLYKKWAEDAHIPTFGFLDTQQNPEEWTRFLLVSKHNLMEEIGPLNHFILAYSQGLSSSS
jgi:hypothetical protein